MTRKQMPRCVHCPRSANTRDHVYPKSWYPTSTDASVQRWTVPSCEECNKNLGEVEKQLLIRLGLGVDPDCIEASGISMKALRSLGVGVELSAAEKPHRYKQRAKILSEMKPFLEIKGKFPLVPGTKPHKGFPEDVQYTITVPGRMLEKLAEKIVRGLEFKLGHRYVEHPYSL